MPVGVALVRGESHASEKASVSGSFAPTGGIGSGSTSSTKLTSSTQTDIFPPKISSTFTVAEFGEA